MQLVYFRPCGTRLELFPVIRRCSHVSNGATIQTKPASHFLATFCSEYFFVLQTFMIDVLFKTIFHHIFFCRIADSTHHVVREGIYTLEFESKTAHCFILIRFWKGDDLSIEKFFRYRLLFELTAGLLIAISRLLSVLPTRSQTVGVSGCPAEVFPLLERFSHFDKEIQYPFRFDALSLSTLMRRRWDSVFGGISFFSQLLFLITFMDGCHNQVWFALIHELGKVGISHCLGYSSVWLGSPIVNFYRQFRPAI